MRMRKKKNLDTRLANCAPVLVSDPEQHKGQWRALFGNTNPLHLEIGCGKGQFITAHAERERLRQGPFHHRDRPPESGHQLSRH